MLDRVEADRAESQRVFDGVRQFLHREGLQQTQYLHILAPAVFLQPRIEQPSQGGEALGQQPAGKRCSLVERSGLVFKQRQIVQRIEDDGFSLIAARVAGDDLARARDRHLMDIASHQHLQMSVTGWHGVVVAAIAHQGK